MSRLGGSPEPAAVFICDAVDTLKIAKDTSIGLMHALLSRNWSVYVVSPAELFLDGNRLRGNVCKVSMDVAGSDAPVRHSQIELQSAPDRELDSFDMALMRVDPPVDARYLKLTWLLDFLDRQVPVFNPPQALRALNEKLSTLHFPESATSVVSGDRRRLLDFAREYKTIIIKPLNAMGGKNVYKFSNSDSNLPVLLEDLLEREDALIAQAYQHAIETEGDKRVLVIAGEPLESALARRPAVGDHRGNLAASAEGTLSQLNAKELALARRVGEWLRERRIPFAGLDLIGGCLTEINITSPTCVREMENLGISGISDRIISAFIDSLNLSRQQPR